MSKKSAGILMYRRLGAEVEVLLVHPGGPFWKNKDEGAWSIPKGEYLEGENPFAVAKREFREEIGVDPEGFFVELLPVKQPGGKIVSAWMVEGECDASCITSNLFSIEWPPRSGRFSEFPEVDRAEWFTLDQAEKKLLKGQLTILQQLRDRLGIPSF